jgi:hypothetical protein
MRNGFRRRGAGRPEMRTSTPPRLSAAASERLLDGGDGPADLRRLLTAAAGPGTASELAGERAAVAAFSATLPGTSPERPSMLQTILSRTMAAKAVTLFMLTAGATGGVALAATSAYAPTETPRSSNSQAADDSARPADDDLDGAVDVGADDIDTPTGDHASDRAGDPSAASPSGPPDQALPGLCRAWLAGAGDNPGRAADNPVFTLLVDTAGGAEEVTDYCDDLVAGSAEHPAGPPADGPAADRPNGPPEDHPGAGAARPDDAPAPPDHPVR